MLSIFEQKDFKQQADRTLPLNRLRNPHGQTPLKPEPTRSVAAPEEPPPVVAAAPAKVPERRPPPPPPAATPEPRPAESAVAAVPAELQQFADQFTRGFREVLATTVRDLQAPINDERRKLDAALDSYESTAKDLEALMSALAEATGRIESLAKSQDELAARADKLEDAANGVRAMAQGLQDAQKAADKRLQLQAGAIRSLDNAVQAGEERLEKLLSSFRTLQGGPSESTARRSLPENL